METGSSDEVSSAHGSEDEDIQHAKTAPVPKSARQATVNKKSKLVFEDETARHSTTTATKKRQVKTAEMAAALPRKVPPVPLNEHGQPILPLQLGVLTVHSLGEIVWDRPAFHNKRYIWPVGYHTSRAYLSGVNPDAQTIYHSRIVDGGVGPQFEVWAEDQPDLIHRAPTSTGAWTAVLKQAQAIRGKEYGNSASGPDFVGLTHASICMLIEQLPNADRCGEYQMKTWDIDASHQPSDLLVSDI